MARCDWLRRRKMRSCVWTNAHVAERNEKCIELLSFDLITLKMRAGVKDTVFIYIFHINSHVHVYIK